MTHNFIRPDELPYLSDPPRDGRAIVVCSFYDHVSDRFEAYSVQAEDRILVLRPVSLAEGAYLATSPQDQERDKRLVFTEAIIQHYSYPEVLRLTQDIERDLINSLASIHKYFILLKHANEQDSLAHRLLVSTEIEYSIANYRAFYDRLQRSIDALHSRLHSNAQQMPDSFARVVGKTNDELSRAYGLPDPLIAFYRKREGLFRAIREIRDNVFHHGHSPELIYHFPDGFAVGFGDRVTDRLLALGLWPEESLKPNNLGSLLPVFAFLVTDMLEAMDELTSAFADSFGLSTPIAEGFNDYLRTEFFSHLNSLSRYQEQHWFGPDDVLTPSS